MKAIRALIVFAILMAPLLNGANPELSLQERLEDRQKASAKNLSPAVQGVMKEGIKVIPIEQVKETAPQLGDIIHPFKLKDFEGNWVSSTSLFAQGPTILTFYRGGWCPYCNLQLAAYQEFLDEFKAVGAKLVAISPETPSQAEATATKQDLGFIVLSDDNNDYAKELGIVFKLTPELAELYKNFNIPLKASKHDSQVYELPLAATFIVNDKGEVIYRFIESDYKKRAEPSELLQALQESN